MCTGNTKNIHNAIKIRGESEEWVMHCADWLLNVPDVSLLMRIRGLIG